jgi:hypothetical protein
MSWGKGILATFIIFALAVISFVTISMRQDIDLVTKDYYGEELKYQDKINKINDSKMLSEKLVIEKNGSRVNIKYPISLSKDITGKINFYRPSDERKDFSLPVEYSSEGMQSVNLENLDKGLWRVKVDWQMSGKSLFNEVNIFVD